MRKRKRTKHSDIFKYKGEPIKITLGTILLVLLCTFLIIIATFTQISFNHFIIPVDTFSHLNSGLDSTEIKQHFLKHYRYIPQIPVILFIAALLGRVFGLLSVLVYIVLGLFFYPVFALGGGPNYIFEYNFGYIFAYIPAVFISGTMLKNSFSLKNILQTVIVAVLIIHIVGIGWTLLIGTFKQMPVNYLFGWIISQSGMKILYDIFFSILSTIFGKFTKKILWIAMC